MLLVIYITNLYRRKISTFFLSKDEILVKKTPTFVHEKKTVCRQWTLILIFCVDVHMGLDPPPPVHMRPPEPDLPPPPCGRHKWMAPIYVHSMMHKCIMVKLLGNEKHVGLKYVKTREFYKIRWEISKSRGIIIFPK